MNENRNLLDKLKEKDNSISRLNDVISAKEKEIESDKKKYCELVTELNVCKQQHEDMLLKLVFIDMCNQPYNMHAVSVA